MSQLTRRGLLGVGAGAMAMSAAIGASRPAAATPRRAEARPGAVEDLPLVGGEEFPIGLFWPPPPMQTTLERYAEIKDAGFTFLITGNYLSDTHIVNHALGFADRVGLRVLVGDDLAIKIVAQRFTISDSDGRLTLNHEEAGAFIREAHGNYSDHPSYAGINFFDEPGPEYFPTLGEAFDLYREITGRHLAYANLLPNIYGDAYDDYLDGFAEQVQPPVISYDRYPLLADGAEDAEYFDNWARVRRAGLKAGLPTWVFIQTLAYTNHREPTEAEFHWQVNVSLAYGAKGIQYFTYWTPDPARGEGFQPGLLTVGGERTERYDFARDLNHDWLRPVGQQLKPLTPETVGHANEPDLPKGAEAWKADDWIRQVSGHPVLVSRFSSPDDADTQWLFVANRSHQKGATAQVITEPRAVGRVDRFDPATAEYTEADSPRRISLDLEPGRAALVRLSKG